MTCECGQADECDGEHATYYPLQDGGRCSVQPCLRPAHLPRYLPEFKPSHGTLTEEDVHRIVRDELAKGGA